MESFEGIDSVPPTLETTTLHTWLPASHLGSTPSNEVDQLGSAVAKEEAALVHHPILRPQKLGQIR